MLAKFIFVSILASLQLATAQSPTPRFRSLAGGFQKFVTEAANQPLDDQIKIWISDVESQAPELYLHIIGRDDASKMESERRTLAEKWFPLLLANSAAILRQFELFETQGRPVIEKLAESYPEANLTSVTVIALPSLIKFNGQVATINGHLYVMFGMDMIALIESNPNLKAGSIMVTDMPVLMSHEFTHAIHYILSDFASGDPTTASFWGPLWAEGLAQVNSQLLNPGSDLPSVFMERVLAAKCTPENIKIWSQEYIEDAKGNEEQIENAYAKWFLSSAGLQEHGTYRAGYCLGYNVILNALRSHSMKDLMKMSRIEAYKIGQETLAAFAQASETH